MHDDDSKTQENFMEQDCHIVFPSKEVSVTNYYYKGQAKSAYQIADAMIKERNKTKEE